MLHNLLYHQQSNACGPTAAERLTLLAGGGTALCLLKGLGSGATVGEALVAASGLQDVSASDHLLGITVATEWDTDQGVARNLARNLRFERIEDADSRAFGGESTTDFKLPRIRADGKCRAIGGSATSIYRDARGTGVSKANGYARAQGGDCYTFHYPVTVAASSGCNGTGGSAATSVGRCNVVADGRSTPFVEYQGFTEGGRAVAAGVQNPSDEQVVTLVHLLTRKQKQGIRRQW